jgi:hypothetical protein
MVARRRPCAWLCVLVAAIAAASALLARPLPALADAAADKATARKLATEGIRLHDAGKHIDAIDRLERAQALLPAATHLLYLARSQVAIGKLVRGAETYRALARFPIGPGASDAFRDAVATGKVELARLEPRIPTLRIAVEPAEPAGLELRVDGEVVSNANLGVDRPIDPGRHRVQAAAPAHNSAESRVEIRAGEHKTVTLRLTPQAGAPAIPATRAPGAQATPSSSVRRHDGFYLRVGVGGGRFEDRFEVEGFRLLGFTLDIAEGRATGPSVSFELAAGGTVGNGLVVGGAVFVEQIANPSIEVNEEPVEQDVSVGTFVLAGPMIDWYLDPTGGLHLQAGVGGASITLRDSSGQEDRDNRPIGGGGAVGIGYDIWVADQVSLGVLARGLFASLTNDGLRHTVNAGALLVTVTYH